MATNQKSKQTNEFVPRDTDDDPNFGGTYYPQKGKVYNLELPNGDAVSVCYWLDNRKPTLQVITSTWCEKTA